MSHDGLKPLSGVARFGRWQWLPLILLAVVMSAGFDHLKIQAALFLAPLLAGLIFSFSGSDLKVPRELTIMSQGVIGVIVARSLDAQILGVLVEHSGAVVFVILATALAACLVAWGLFRFSAIDDETAAWGSMPGAAGIMVAFAAEYGGDTRLVAFMQYLRLIVVVASASLLAGLLAKTALVDGTTASSAAGALRHVDMNMRDVAATVVVAAVCTILGKVSRIPAGPLLLTAVAGGILHLNGWLDMTLPHWLLAGAYGLIGLYVGLQFDRMILRFAVRNLPAMLMAIAALIGLCSLVAVGFAHMMGADLLTAYLATTPGAIDSIAILALDSRADMSVVMSVQTIRFFSVIILAPYLVRFIHHLGTRMARAGK